MSKYTNHLDISANKYADNIAKAITHFDKIKDNKSAYEQEVEDFNDRCIEVFKVNRLRCNEADIKKHEKSIRSKANKKIRLMIRTTESELLRLNKDRAKQNLLDTCSKFSVNIKTIQKIL
jgi:hypothetical protein